MNIEQIITNLTPSTYRNCAGIYLVFFLIEGEWFIKVGNTQNFLKRFISLKNEFEIDFDEKYMKYGKNISNMIVGYLVPCDSKRHEFDKQFNTLMKENNLSANYYDKFGREKREVYKMDPLVILNFFEFFDSKNVNIEYISKGIKILWKEPITYYGVKLNKDENYINKELNYKK